MHALPPGGPRALPSPRRQFALALLLAAAGCGGGGGGAPTTATPTTASAPAPAIADIQVARTFDFEMTRVVRLSVRVVTAEGRPLEGVVITAADGADRRIGAGATDVSGLYEADLAVPTAERRLVVRAATVGIPSEATIDVADLVTVHFGS